MQSNLLRGLVSSASALALVAGLTGGAEAHHVSGSNAQAGQSGSIELGTSGSSREHIVSKNRLFCYAGTLGALVTAGGTDYILSNNHVLAKENGLLSQGTGADGEIIQPGLLDLGRCTTSSGNNAGQVATLTSYIDILFGKGRNKPANEVDAAIAAVNGNAVVANGSILGIGPLSGYTISALDAVGEKVQKTGRTTGHTFGTVLALQVEIDVKYESGTARFINQLRIRHACEGLDFSDSGDSGSQIVTVPSAGDPDSVGLLFAGSDADTFANPMEAVVSALNVSVVSGDNNDNTGAMLGDYPSSADDCPSGGGGGSGGPGGPGGRGGPPFSTIDPAGLAIASDVKARNSETIFALPDVVGHGIGFDQDGEAVVEIYVAGKARRAAGQPLPAAIEGIPVRVIETGVIQAF